MGRFFSLDSPTMAFLSRVADLMILNIIVLIVCIPFVTIGPALTAMHHVLLRMVRKEEGYIVRPFFRALKANFKPALICWLIMILFIVVLAVDWRILNESGLEFAVWLRLALMAVELFAAMTALYVFPLIARFENKIMATFKNALFISILNLPKTALMLLVCVAPIVIVYLNPGMMPLLLLLGISVPGYLCAVLYSNIFKRFEPEAEEIDGDRWTVSLEDEPR